MQYLFVDNMNGVVLVSMLDKATRAYDLCSKQPCIKYVGHDEVVRGVDYLPEKGLYITGLQFSCRFMPLSMMRMMYRMVSATKKHAWS